MQACRHAFLRMYTRTPTRQPPLIHPSACPPTTAPTPTGTTAHTTHVAGSELIISVPENVESLIIDIDAVHSPARTQLRVCVCACVPQRRRGAHTGPTRAASPDRCARTPRGEEHTRTGVRCSRATQPRTYALLQPPRPRGGWTRGFWGAGPAASGAPGPRPLPPRDVRSLGPHAGSPRPPRTDTVAQPRTVSCVVRCPTSSRSRANMLGVAENGRRSGTPCAVCNPRILFSAAMAMA